MKKIFNFLLALAFFISATTYSFGFAFAVSSEESVYAEGGTPIYTVNETITYHYKVEDEEFFPEKIPGYLSSYTCGITAGGNIVGYYDRDYEDLIPNHTGRYLLGKWLWGRTVPRLIICFHRYIL